MRLIHGDCLDALRTLPDNSVDSVVTDPPYALSDLRKRDGYCLRQILSEVQFPGDDDRDAVVRWAEQRVVRAASTLFGEGEAG